MPSHFHNENLPSGVKLSFLESQVSASAVLESGTEFRYWLLATVNHLLEKGICSVHLCLLLVIFFNTIRARMSIAIDTR